MSDPLPPRFARRQGVNYDTDFVRTSITAERDGRFARRASDAQGGVLLLTKRVFLPAAALPIAPIASVRDLAIRVPRPGRRRWPMILHSLLSPFQPLQIPDIF